MISALLLSLCMTSAPYPDPYIGAGFGLFTATAGSHRAKKTPNSWLIGLPFNYHTIEDDEYFDLKLLFTPEMRIGGEFVSFEFLTGAEMEMPWNYEGSHGLFMSLQGGVFYAHVLKVREGSLADIGKHEFGAALDYNVGPYLYFTDKFSSRLRIGLQMWMGDMQGQLFRSGFTNWVAIWMNTGIQVNF